jgi:hypothetical protein
MRSRRRALILASGIAALAACSRPGGSDADPVTSEQHVAQACRDVDPARMPDASAPTPSDGYTTVAERDSLLRILDAGERKWRGARPANYTMTVIASCFCRDRDMPVVLRVVADSVVFSRDTTGQQSWPDDWRVGLHVAGLFKEARQFACDSTSTTRVSLDPTLGYPSLLLTQSRLEFSDSDRQYRVLWLSPDPAQ